MKRGIFTVGGIVLFSIVFGLSSAEVRAVSFDRGGVTFPMEEISGRRFSLSEDAANNLLHPGEFLEDGRKAWTVSRWIFGGENREKYMAPAKGITSVNTSEMDGVRAFELSRPQKLEELMGDKVSSFYISINQLVKLPDLKGGTYRLTLESRNQLIGKYKHNNMVLVYFKDGSDARPGRGKETRGYLYSHIEDGPAWHPHSIDIAIPPKTRDLELSFRADGAGKLLIRKPQLVKLDQGKQPLSVQLAPGEMLDNVYALGSGDPGLVSFRFRNNLPKGKLPRKKYVFNLELPAEIEVRGTSSYFGRTFGKTSVTLNGRPAYRWQTSCDVIVDTVRYSQEFNGWHVPAVMIVSGEKAGRKFENCRYYVTCEEKMVSNPETFSVLMIPAMKRVAAPRQFLGGFSSVGADLKFHQQEVQELLAEFIAGTGSTLIAGAGGPELKALLRQKGVRYITSESWGFANGYRLGFVEEQKKPAYSFYRDKDGKPVHNGIACSCPAAIYNKTPYYYEVVVPQLKENLKGLNGLQPNWEPYSFKAKGCFCDTCREEFARYAGISSEKAKEIWPDQLLPGYPYSEKGIRFRGYQHGRVIKTLNEEALRLGGTPVGFCPEVGTDQIIRYPSYFTGQGEFTPYEYAGELNWLNVWGPYVWFLADQPYNYSKGSHLIYWETSRRVHRDYRSHFKNPAKRAKLMAMPHGNQCGLTALGQPEGLAMDQLSAFLSGYDASELYFFPRGYDHRYWQALAETNALAAAYEDLVMNGRRINTASAVPETPFPAPLENPAPDMLPEVRQSNLLQVLTFARENRSLVAIGNFWEKGDVVCRMRLPGLKGRKKYQVIEKTFGRQYVKSGSQFFTGENLSEGILLHVGALRWAFFEIVPVGRQAYDGEKVSAERMEQERERCRKDNQKAFREEEARDRALHAENDIGELKSFTEGQFVCRPVEKEGRKMLEISSGTQGLIRLNPKGMVLDSWKLEKTDYGSSLTGISAFWTPGRNGMVADVNYRIMDQKMTPEGYQITGEMTTTTRNYPQLHGLKLEKTVLIAQNLKKATVTVKLHNTQAVAMNDVGYRWNMLAPAWSNQYRGTIDCAGKTFQRPRDFSLLAKDCDPGTEKTIRRLFQVKKPTVPVSSGDFLMRLAPGNALAVSLLPADQFAGTAIWDTPNMIAATFEPFYKKITIPPGEKVVYSIVFAVSE